MVYPFNGPCGHASCYSCLKQWLLQNSSCPICRGELHDRPLLNNNLKTITAHSLDFAKQLNPDIVDALNSAVAVVKGDYQKDLEGEGLFPNVFARATVDEDDEGVKRCSNCFWEVLGTICDHCGTRIININEDEEEINGDEGPIFTDEDDEYWSNDDEPIIAEAGADDASEVASNLDAEDAVENDNNNIVNDNDINDSNKNKKINNNKQQANYEDEYNSDDSFIDDDSSLEDEIEIQNALSAIDVPDEELDVFSRMDLKFLLDDIVDSVKELQEQVDEETKENRHFNSQNIQRKIDHKLSIIDRLNEFGEKIKHRMNNKERPKRLAYIIRTEDGVDFLDSDNEKTTTSEMQTTVKAEQKHKIESDNIEPPIKIFKMKQSSELTESVPASKTEQQRRHYHVVMAGSSDDDDISFQGEEPIHETEQPTDDNVKVEELEGEPSKGIEGLKAARDLLRKSEQ